MSKAKNQKMKMLRLARFFHEFTGESRSFTRKEIVTIMDKYYDVRVTDEGLKNDIDELVTEGFVIEITHDTGKDNLYYMKEHPITVAEGKYLIDILQASSFLPEEETRAMIRKIKRLVGAVYWNELKRCEFIMGRPKTTNHDIFVVLDSINDAINANRCILFKYYRWNEKKCLVERHPGKIYQISPLGLVWMGERYYLIGYDFEEEKIKHFRIDKMNYTSVDSTRRREHTELIAEGKLPDYAKMNFGMCAADEKPVAVTLSSDKEHVGLLIDQFGQDISIINDTNNTNRVTTRVKVFAGSTFFGWLVSQNNLVRLEGPSYIVDKFKSELSILLNSY